MKPLTLLLTSLMVLIGFILIVFGCMFGYIAISLHAIKSYNPLQLTVDCVFAAIALGMGILLFYKGIKLVKKKI